MHEYSIVQAMFDQIERVAQTHGAQTVRRIRVRIGEFAGVDPTLFQSAYEVYRIGTPCADAVLQIEHVAAGDDLILDQVELEVR
ncbi:MAG TPA: hydrogenase maturation nickel metallochaperone HypA [Vicinamibacterales bacterium]|nr:hydrogenase maturation nickel metallochaperone HypA [Vicinamibacterales bacterium]